MTFTRFFHLFRKALRKHDKFEPGRLVSFIRFDTNGGHAYSPCDPADFVYWFKTNKFNKFWKEQNEEVGLGERRYALIRFASEEKIPLGFTVKERNRVRRLRKILLRIIKDSRRGGTKQRRWQRSIEYEAARLKK